MTPFAYTYITCLSGNVEIAPEIRTPFAGQPCGSCCREKDLFLVRSFFYTTLSNTRIITSPWHNADGEVEEHRKMFCILRCNAIFSFMHGVHPARASGQ